MRRLFIVYGTNSNAEKVLTPHILEDLETNEVCVIRLKDLDPHAALKHVLEALRPYEKNYQNLLVAYSGENLHLLQDNLPCRKVDMATLRIKTIERIGGSKTERDQEVLAQAFSAVILRKLDPTPVVNQRDY